MVFIKVVSSREREREGNCQISTPFKIQTQDIFHICVQGLKGSGICAQLNLSEGSTAQYTFGDEDRTITTIRFLLMVTLP